MPQPEKPVGVIEMKKAQAKPQRNTEERVFSHLQRKRSLPLASFPGPWVTAAVGDVYSPSLQNYYLCSLGRLPPVWGDVLSVAGLVLLPLAACRPQARTLKIKHKSFGLSLL